MTKLGHQWLHAVQQSERRHARGKHGEVGAPKLRRRMSNQRIGLTIHGIWPGFYRLCRILFFCRVCLYILEIDRLQRMMSVG